MPTYEWTGTDDFRDSRNDRTVEPGETVDLDAHVGDPQKQMVRVEDEDVSLDGTSQLTTAESDDSHGDETDESGASGDSSDDTADGSDGDAEDAEPAGTFDAAAVSDEHWNSVVTAIEAGKYDDHLDALGEADDRDSVQNAIAERRDELNE